MKEIFPSIPGIRFEGAESKNPLSFKHYNPEEVVGEKTMREQLKFAVSYWHTLCGEGTDMFGSGTADKSFGSGSQMQIYENKVYAAFEIMENLA